ncbi:MAG TPA: SDR family oxidoreductase [Bacteroidales bacterium]|nr:SDR family oxidoreductase [Bacteroidales bacterium]
MRNKVMIVTGASSGIGRALAIEGLKRGMKVALAARNLHGLNETIAASGANPGSYLVVETDVTRKEDCHNLVKATIEKFGQIDVLVNNAGISMRALFEEVDLSVLHRLMEVNFWGMVYCTRFALPYLLESKGSIAGISSIAGHKGLPGRTGYSASKFAMHGFLESLRIENLRKGLHVLIACPGFTASNIRIAALTGDGSAQGESPRAEEKMMTAERVAWLILQAVEKRKNSLVLTMQGKLTVWLNKFLPSVVDKLVLKHMALETDSPLK